MSFRTQIDYLIEVAKGNIPGTTVAGFAGAKPNITTSFETMWDIAGNFTFPTGDEAWEVLSSDADDTSAGTGARSILITGLDTNFDPVTEIVSLDGVTPVATTRTDWNRINDIFVVSSGSSENNEGTITLRVASAGATRATILPTLARSFNGFFTVPTGKVFMVLQTASFTPKGEDIVIRNRIKLDGTNTFLAGGDVSTYQNESMIAFKAIPIFAEKTDIEITAKSSNAAVSGILNIEGILVDADQIGTNFSNSLF